MLTAEGRNEMGWRPLSKRGRPDPEYDALHEGVPPWLTRTVLDWMRPVFRRTNDYGHFIPNMDRVREAERRLRDVQLGIGSDEGLLGSFYSQIATDDEVLLDALDLAISFERLEAWGDEEVTDRLVELEAALEQAGSAWRVANYPGRYSCLERRVDETVTKAARETMSAAGKAGQHLAAAWIERSYAGGQERDEPGNAERGPCLQFALHAGSEPPHAHVGWRVRPRPSPGPPTRRVGHRDEVPSVCR